MQDELPSNNIHGGTWHVLVAGLVRPVEPLVLGPGITLQPIEEPLTIFDLAAAGSRGFRGWSMLEPISSACTAEIVSEDAKATAPGYDSLNRAWLASSLLVLRGFTAHNNIACSIFPWRMIAGYEKRSRKNWSSFQDESGCVAISDSGRTQLPQFMGNLLDFHLSILVNQGARKGEVKPEDAAWVSDHFEIANKLAADSRTFRFGIEAAVDWRFARNARSAIARIWSGIEAIYGINSELVYRISLLSAAILAERGDQRKRKFEQVKALYSLRSKAVHGETITDDKLAQAVDESYKLLADLILLSLAKSHALDKGDFDEAIFS